MQDWRDAAQLECRTNNRDAGKGYSEEEGGMKRGIQEMRDAGKGGCRTGGSRKEGMQDRQMQDTRDCRTERMQDSRDAGM